MNTSARIIGLAGTFASGKDSLAQFLEEYCRIKHISTSDIVREFAMHQHGSIERPILYKTANDLRDNRGAGILSEIAIERYGLYKDKYPEGVCISGLRASAEAAVIREHGGVVVFTDAPARIRYKRTITRSRDNEKSSSFKEFLQRESLENGEVNSEFSLASLKLEADIVLDNSKKMTDFLTDSVRALGLQVILEK